MKTNKKWDERVERWTDDPVRNTNPNKQKQISERIRKAREKLSKRTNRV